MMWLVRWVWRYSRFSNHCFAVGAVSAVLCLTLGCRSRDVGPDAAGTQTRRVFAAHRGIAYFARRIGGADVDVWLPVPPGIDPQHWRPSAEELRQIQACRLILLDYPGYSSWVTTSSLPLTRVVDTTRPLRDRLIRLEGAVTHRHGPGGTHTHAGYAPGAWLDPDLARLQAQAVRSALGKAFPERQEEFESRFKQLADELDQWRSELEQLAKRTRGTPLLASHPVYDYLARRGGWPIQSVHFEPNQMPGEEEWQKLWTLQQQSGARVMLWEDTPIEAIRRKLAEREITVVVYRLLDRRAPDDNGAEETEDWVEAMRANVRRLAEALPVR